MTRSRIRKSALTVLAASCFLLTAPFSSVADDHDEIIEWIEGHGQDPPIPVIPPTANPAGSAEALLAEGAALLVRVASL